MRGSEAAFNQVATRASEVYGTVRMLLTLISPRLTQIAPLRVDISKTQQYQNSHDMG